ncbi:AP endonuclease family 2 [Hyperthermus butylicus DSM 5456]|uniref:AP endonuclease family 2 n=2 Tax=Hyperthermus butylicus TaxID=54248 RepID=A2BJW8_HYPBU|nr:AP endonuclease family 2 [Hyperthermus butylicus DSM 5456]
MLVLASTRTIPAMLPESIRILYEAGFDSVDVSYNNIERFDIDYPSAYSYFRAALQEASRLGVKPLTLHAPWEEYYLIMLGKNIEYAVEEARILLDMAYSYGVDVVVFHPFSAQRVGESRVVWLNKKFFALLADYSEHEGLSIVAIENAERRKPWNSIAAITSLARSVGSQRLSVCIDVGHANINGYTPQRIGEELEGVEPICIHIHDNDGREDKHELPGTGTIDWEGIASLESIVTARYHVAEVDCNGSPRLCAVKARIATTVISQLYLKYQA